MITGPALLFCPGDRPDRYAKAFDRADSVIIDLEDAVAPTDKETARAALVATPLDPDRVIVRVNPRSSEFFDADLAAVAQTPYRAIMLPKAERPSDLDGLEGYEVIALCETPVGIRDVDALAADPRVAALTWGAEDLVAGIGGFKSRTPDGRLGKLAEYARARVLIAAAAAGKPAFDTVRTDLADDEGLREEASEAAASGFRGAMCLHPRQVPVLREAYLPDAVAIEWATGVLAAWANAPSGVFAYNGQMIDEPLLRQARRIAEVADAAEDAATGEATGAGNTPGAAG
ncbi:HpcH/HpaI aldolase/citrate lyase family protein [Leucobacter aridicollis]|uniref:HpcH/HpaI aldolase/citrate lyase family protein n=1 Tax=Leucobacter aridicollis TaxID=283878 RepID=UPI00216A8035|nr:CoA ester lyase [Leucobacter aridicollis]MCS3427510.1 citrate lyase subunit beta/citryl-CoA lyase [Leucobacter aridicollis]